MPNESLEVAMALAQTRIEQHERSFTESRSDIKEILKAVRALDLQMAVMPSAVSTALQPVIARVEALERDKTTVVGGWKAVTVLAGMVISLTGLVSWVMNLWTRKP